MAYVLWFAVCGFMALRAGFFGHKKIQIENAFVVRDPFHDWQIMIMSEKDILDR